MLLKKDKKGINLISMLLKSSIIIFISLFFVWGILNLKTVEYDDKEVLANITLFTFVRNCINNSSFEFSNINDDKSLKCINIPETIYIKGLLNNNILFEEGNINLKDMEAFCDSLGSIYCKKKELFLFFNENKTNLTQLKILIIVTS